MSGHVYCSLTQRQPGDLRLPSQPGQPGLLHHSHRTPAVTPPIERRRCRSLGSSPACCSFRLVIGWRSLSPACSELGPLCPPHLAPAAPLRCCMVWKNPPACRRASRFRLLAWASLSSWPGGVTRRSAARVQMAPCSGPPLGAAGPRAARPPPAPPSAASPGQLCHAAMLWSARSIP